MIPKEYTKFCEWTTIEFCPYLIHKDCPETCSYAISILNSSALLSKQTLESLLENNEGNS